MILPAQTIRRLCQTEAKSSGGVVLYTQKPLIAPFYEQSKEGGMTYGLGPASYDVRIAEDVLLRAGAFTLASTVERFCIPADIAAMVCDKSTWARKGLALQNTFLDPGWEGYLTIELSNHSHEMIGIAAGTPIAQIVFMWLEKPTEQPYVGKYQNQKIGAQEAILDDSTSPTQKAVEKLKRRDVHKDR